MKINSGGEISFRERFEKALPKMRKVAKSLGYAIAIHGSMKRDFDIVVIPWAEDAVDSYEVAHAIREVSGGARWRCPHTKGNAPYGREWWPFDWKDSSHNNKDYVDMSIIPRWNKANPTHDDIRKDQTEKFRTMLEKMAYDWRHSERDMDGIGKVINKFKEEFGG